MDFLVGVKEVGEILGWDRRKVSTYQLRGVLPKPVVHLYSGPIWFRKQIEFYKARKDFSVRTYYIKGEMVFECTHNQPFKDTSYSPNDIKEQIGNFILYQEKDVQQLKNAILDKKPIVQFLSFDSISILHDLGILETVVFQDYIQQYAIKYQESIKEGWVKE